MLKRPEGETCSNKFHLKYNKRLFKITIKSKMFRETLAYGVNPFDFMKTLSLETINPYGSSQAMYNFWKANVKLNRRVLTVNLLRCLVSQNCGTNDVMSTASSMGKCSYRKGSGERFRKILMKEKLNDALFDENQIRKQFEVCRNRYYKSITRNSEVDRQFQNMMKLKVENDWKEGKSKNKAKVQHLVSKWGPFNDKQDEKLRNIKYLDKDFEATIEVSDKNKEAVVYGNVETSDNEKEVLKMNPKLKVFGPVKPWDIEVAVELGYTKYRYSQINKNKNEEVGSEDDNEDNDVLNWSKLK